MDRLPLELHIRIGRHLHTQDLYQLVLVSKSYHSTFTPELYREIMISGEYQESNTNSYWPSVPVTRKSRPPGRCLPYALSEHPVLAGFVRSLVLLPLAHQGSPQLKPSRALQETDWLGSLLPHPVTRQTILCWQKALDSDEKLDSRQPLRNPWFALLLLQLKNLRRLSVYLPCEERVSGLNYTSATPYFDSVIHGAAKPGSGILPRLTHLTINEAHLRWHHKRSGIPLSQLAPFLRIPSLRYIRVGQLTENNKQALPRDFSCGITHIDIEQCDKTITQLPRLLSGCSKLESFTWALEESTHHFYNDPHSPAYHWNPNRVYAPLYEARSTLRHLTMISYECSGNMFLFHDLEYPQPAYFGPLCDFPVLETLNMPMVNLMPFHPGTHVPVSPLWETLPSSLKSLSIYGCLLQSSHMLCDELEDLAAHCQTHFPLLNMVYIVYSSFEKINGQQCRACRGELSPKYDMVKRDPVIDGRLEALKVRFKMLGVILAVNESMNWF
ncbi:hypothetical protein CBS147346_7606 [Aspergillus niger]|nr:hypothetical protein CBS147346_7606 [Aspergillus niger]